MRMPSSPSSQRTVAIPRRYIAIQRCQGGCPDPDRPAPDQGSRGRTAVTRRLSDRARQWAPGLPAGDACALPFDPLLSDSAGWPCLRFASSKMRAEHQLPLSARAVEAIRVQQDHVREHCPDGSAWLFPSRPDPEQPVPYETLRKAFKSWQERIGLHDKTGCATTVTIHQFRHTFGTRLINSGVPQHVIQRLLGHASPEMTAVYANPRELHQTGVTDASFRVLAV